MTTPLALDYLSTTICQLVPRRIEWGPGWYLVAANQRVEAGPFGCELDAIQVAYWLDDQGLGVHPIFENDGPPYLARYSQVGLIVGSRIRDRAKVKKKAPELVAVGR